MRKKLLFVLTCFLCVNMAAKAAPGDTTWVQANSTRLPGFGAYDDTVKFPGMNKTYSRIYMIFTLGKYKCDGYDPANPGDKAGQTGWCGDWDYTVLHYLVMPNGNTLELGRMISPYANSLAPRTPWEWTQRYVYDVTDYAPVLHDSAVMRIFFSGYSGGFTGDIKFAFIEGTPDRPVLGVHRLWTGSYGYGGAISINTHFTPITDTAPKYTASTALKFTVTGHGSDANGCCEFAPHSYDVLLNGGVAASTTIWRDDCGANELFPQSGTWLLQRANWCPGATVYPYYYQLKGITSGKVFNTALQFEDYSGGGSYTTEGQLFFYGDMKKSLDASVEEIIAPSNNENHFRENPSSGSPVIRIKNRGRDMIRTITFRYGVNGNLSETYTWTGALASLGEAEVTFPVMAKLTSLSDTVAHTYNFNMLIASVNGEAADADKTNDVMTSSFATVPVWPSQFRIAFATNNEGTVLNPNISETSWIIYDAMGNIVKQRANVAIKSTFIDTVTLAPGTYSLRLYDSSCDGLNWWFHAAAGDGITSGSFFVRKMTSTTTIPVTGYSYTGSYAHDFGCGITHYFTIAPKVSGVTELTGANVKLTAYPNPAQDRVNVTIDGIDNVKGRLSVIDALGRVVIAEDCSDSHKDINVSRLSNGVYTLLFAGEGTGNKLTTRLLIAK